MAWVEGSILFSKCVFYLSVISLVLFDQMFLFFQVSKILSGKEEKKEKSDAALPTAYPFGQLIGGSLRI